MLIRNNPLARRVNAGYLALLLAPIFLAACNSDRPNTRAADGKVDGGKVYELYCAGCHGPDGKRGEGPMRLVDGRRKPEAEIRAVVENGRNEMPGWKKRLQAEELSAVVEHTQRLEAPPAAP